jgi:serine/threonine-protein kinase
MLDPHEALHEELSDRYELQDVLGEGGMGTVYLARDLKHDRPVAIKTIHPDRTTQEVRKRFEREVRVTASLQHPHILPLIDSGVAGETLYYVMPHVEGESLRSRLARDERLPIHEAVRIASDVAEGLEYAHQNGVVHRDIKPANILLTSGYALIADFGIAALADARGGETLTQTGLAIGTPAYMAPEQFAGVATPRSDLYSLGAVMYEVLAGRRWNLGAGAEKTDWMGVPLALRLVLERALSLEPDDRWPNARAFREALAEAGAPRRESRAPGARASASASILQRLRQSFRRPRAAPPTPAQSIAVLPLANLNRDEETEYFSDGITEDIIAHLSRIRDLKVISRTSVMRLKSTTKSIREISEELGVATILDGSVRRSKDRVRIVSQLIDAATDEQMWTETYDREMTDIFAIQSEVAEHIAAALRVTISSGERSLIKQRPTDDPEAHNLYLKGRYLWNRRTSAGLASAAECFRQAIGCDPLYAPAYAGLADAYLLLGSYGYMPEVEALRKTKAAVERALELDDRLAEAHASRGQVLRSERDWRGEESEYLRAIELNPNYATAHQWYATLLAALGRGEEALDEIRRAEELDPLSHAVSVTAGIVRFVNRDYEGAIEQLEKTLELEPDYFSAYAWLQGAYSELGRYEEAIRAYERLAELRPDMPGSDLSLALIHARCGRREKALEILDQVEQGGSDQAWSGVVYGLLGERTRALELLERSFDDESWRMFVLHRNLLFYLKVGPWFDPLRSDTRFKDLLRRMNFPE